MRGVIAGWQHASGAMSHATVGRSAEGQMSGNVPGRLVKILLIVLLAVMVGGCSAIAGIFKAGVWVGVIIVLVVLVLVFALFGRRG